MKKMEFGEIGYYDLNKNDAKMPIMEIIVTDTEDDKMREVYYLSPFRLRHFQVSGSFEGNIDYGSSLDYDFEDYFDLLNDNILFAMIRGQISEALISFSRYPFNRKEYGCMIMPNMHPVYFGDNVESGIIKFINDTIKCYKAYFAK